MQVWMKCGRGYYIDARLVEEELDDDSFYRFKSYKWIPPRVNRKVVIQAYYNL